MTKRQAIKEVRLQAIIKKHKKIKMFFKKSFMKFVKKTILSREIEIRLSNIQYARIKK